MTEKITLTRSLEDYLATIWKIIQEKKFARVKDIAAARNVKPGSVSPAMSKLAKLELIVYVRREFIELTPTGQKIAEQLASRHDLLITFFQTILNVPSKEANDTACAIEHCLSEEATTRLSNLIKFLKKERPNEFKLSAPKHVNVTEITIADMLPGQTATVHLIRATGELNHTLIDLGLLPDSKIRLINFQTTPNLTYTIELQGFEITLSDEQASAVVVIL